MAIYSGFTNSKWRFSIVMLVYQRVWFGVALVFGADMQILFACSSRRHLEARFGGLSMNCRQPLPSSSVVGMFKSSK